MHGIETQCLFHVGERNLSKPPCKSRWAQKEILRESWRKLGLLTIVLQKWKYCWWRGTGAVGCNANYTYFWCIYSLPHPLNAVVLHLESGVLQRHQHPIASCRYPLLYVIFHTSAAIPVLSRQTWNSVEIHVVRVYSTFSYTHVVWCCSLCLRAGSVTQRDGAHLLYHVLFSLNGLIHPVPTDPHQEVFIIQR